jgi:hypothetical protein
MLVMTVHISIPVREIDDGISALKFLVVLFCAIVGFNLVLCLAL